MTTRAFITMTTPLIDPAVFVADDAEQLAALADEVHAVRDPRLRFSGSVHGSWEANGQRTPVRARDLAGIELLPGR